MWQGLRAMLPLSVIPARRGSFLLYESPLPLKSFGVKRAPRRTTGMLPAGTGMALQRIIPYPRVSVTTVISDRAPSRTGGPQ
jgi:hypothetical protein